MKIKDIFNKKKVPTEKDYYFGNYKISLSEQHILDKYQEQFPLYDRFLPLLCSEFKGLIIDIGANIGDTSIAIFSQNDDAFIVGVEPDEEFFNECVVNIEKNALSHRFLGVNRFVTTQTGSFVVKRSDSLSTGSIEKADSDENSQNNNSVSFSQLMELVREDKKRPFDMLKIDTDGFDWDILKSFYDYAKEGSVVPDFIFFEMQTFLNNAERDIEGRDAIIAKYADALDKINQLGYTEFCLFDNYGTLLKKTTSVEEIKEFNQYIKRSQIHNHHSTMYYLDVLAYKAPSGAYVDSILSKQYS
jgi:FkbM family methyltransferase